MAESFPIRFGKYELTERLAIGGMAELFLATVDGEHGFARRVVIKRLLPHLAADQGYTAMFIDEAKLTARLVHPKIAQTYELGKVGTQLYIAMEHIDGVDVLALLRELATRRERLAVDLAVWIAQEVCDALDYAHQLAGPDGTLLGVVHRDISPSNILLSRRGDVKLVDFGIARATEPGRHHRTKSGTLKGKYGYMSPEQVLEQPVDARSDLFSVGIVLAEMLCGRRLFAAPAELDVLLMVRDAKLARLDEFGKHIEPSLDAIVRKALKKDPHDRYAGAGEMRDALADWLFQHRLRIAPKRVAEVVESVYERVWQRRRASAVDDLVLPDDSGQEAAAAVAAPPAVASPRAPTSAETPWARAPSNSDDLHDGIPRGYADPGDSLPIMVVEETPPVAPPPARLKVVVPPLPERSGTTVPPPPVRVERSDAAIPIARIETRTVPSRPQPPPPPQPSAPTDDDFELALAGLDLLGDDDDDRSTDERKAVRPVLDQPSVRYSSIEAAVSAMARKAPDPSTVELDGSLVGNRRAPTAEPLHLTPDDLRAAARKPPPALAEIEDTPEENGDFSQVAPLRVLYRLLAGRKTGLLVVTVGAIKKEIYVRDGMPEYVSSNVSSELLGNWLVQQSVLSQGELAMALAMMPHYGGKLGDTVVGLGLLKPLEVFRHLTRQVRMKLIDVCTWSRGNYAWYANRTNEREAFPLDLNAFEVLGAAAMSAPESMVDGWYEKFRGKQLRATKAKHGPDRFEIQGLRSVYDALDGKKTVHELLARFTDTDERQRVARMLLLLEMSELARPIE